MDIASENIFSLLAPKTRPLSILVVEDDQMDALFLSRQIRNLGHDPWEVGSADEALDILKKDKLPVDVVLMDRLMPKLDGMAAARMIHEDPELRHIPVVMITGAVAPREIQEGLDNGVFYYLTKPANEDVLCSVLLAATREARQNRTPIGGPKRHRVLADILI